MLLKELFKSAAVSSRDLHAYINTYSNDSHGMYFVTRRTCAGEFPFLTFFLLCPLVIYLEAHVAWWHALLGESGLTLSPLEGHMARCHTLEKIIFQGLSKKYCKCSDGSFL